MPGLEEERLANPPRPARGPLARGRMMRNGPAQDPGDREQRPLLSPRQVLDELQVRGHDVSPLAPTRSPGRSQACFRTPSLSDPTTPYVDKKSPLSRHLL